MLEYHDDIPEEIIHSVFDVRQRDLSRFDLGKIKYAVYKVKQLICGVLDVAGVLKKLRFIIVPHDDLTHALYDIDRGTDLMRYVCQKIGLCLVCGIRGDTQFIHLLYLLFGIRDIKEYDRITDKV